VRFMRAYDVILKKRNGNSLTTEEIRFMINGYMDGTVPNYQMAAFVMAVFFRNLDPKETSDLTAALVDSGMRADLSDIPGIKVDKHSTGGVGDKTTLILVPLVASLGLRVAKMSGRGLGHTGGTIDKLKSIPGFRTDMTIKEFVRIAKEVGAAIVGQSKDLVPADKKLYALRDVTATVDSIPLIASSVMSKKIAAGCDAIVLDVKVGGGAFMKNREEARALARLMVDIGSQMSIPTVAVLSRMDQPLGQAVGNALEVSEAIATLRGQGPEDLEELCVELGAQMLCFGEDNRNFAEIKRDLRDSLDTGKALEKFRDIITAQGGDPAVIEHPEKLPRAGYVKEVTAVEEGYVTFMDAEKIGLAAMVLGAGRKTKEDEIDPAAGLIVNKKIGETVKKGEILAEMHTNDPAALERVEELVYRAYGIGRQKATPLPLVLEIIRDK